MTTYAVGPSGADFRTLADAERAAKPGDIIIVRSGVYRELVKLVTPGVIWRADVGESPVIDGGWNGTTIISGFINLVAIPGDGVVFDGFRVINSPGRGIATSGNGVVIRLNVVNNCYHTGILANGSGANGISDVLIEFNTLTLLGMGRLATGGGRVSGSLATVNVHNSVIRGNSVSGGHGEGINIDKGSYEIEADGNIVHDCAHAYVYFNHSRNCVARNNVLYNSQDPDFHHDAGWPAGVVFGDERSASETFAPQSGNVFENNLIVNLGKLLQVRNNDKAQAGYDTQLKNHIIRGNTFISGVATDETIDIQENMRGRPHQSSVFENNIVLGKPGRCNAPGVRFEHNAWTVEQPANMRSGSDVRFTVADLTAPLTTINGSYKGSDFSIENYRPVAGSVLDGEFGALDAIQVEPPPDPDPEPETPWRETLDERERVLIANVEAFYGGIPAWIPDQWVYGLVGKLAALLDEKA